MLFLPFVVTIQYVDAVDWNGSGVFANLLAPAFSKNSSLFGAKCDSDWLQRNSSVKQKSKLLLYL